MNPTEYTAETRHVAARWNGEHVFTVQRAPGIEPAKYYATAPDWGCSRDCDTPRAAIRDLVRSAGAELVSVFVRMENPPAPPAVPVYATRARSAASFNLNMALLMLHAGRDDEARDAFHKLVAVIEALPADLEVALPLEAVR